MVIQGALANGRRHQAGVAYVAAMLAVALVALVAAHSLRAGASLSQHDAEEELLSVGLEIQLALQRYANASPAGVHRSPESLEALLRDARHPGVVRHMRSVPVDPMTGNTDWVLVRDARNLVIAVHSASFRKPLKVSGFPPSLARLEGERRSYRDWIFGGVPP